LADAVSANLKPADVTVLGYHEAQEALSDYERFSNEIYELIMGPVMGDRKSVV